MSGSAWFPLIPLGIAFGALAVREATRALPSDPKRVHASAEFVPPDLALLGARAAATEQALLVDARQSTARVGGLELARVLEGSAVVRAGDEGWTLEVVLELPDASPTADRLTLRLRTREVLASAVPGCRTADLRGTWAADSLGGDVRIDASWMRMPGGVARLQGVTKIEGLTVGEGQAARERGDGLTLALELQLVPRETRR